MEVQQYPKMIFSVIHGHCVVQNEDELQVKLEEGWQTSPAQQFSEASIREKIAFHLAELERWENALEAYRKAPVKEEPEEVIEPVEEPEVSPEPEAPAEPTSTIFYGKIPDIELTPMEGTPVSKVGRPKSIPIKKAK